MNKRDSGLIDLSVFFVSVFVWFWFGQSDLLQSISDTGLRGWIFLFFSVALFVVCSLMIKHEVVQSLPNMIVRSIDGYFSRVSTSEDKSNDDNKEGVTMNKYVVFGLSVSSLLLLATSFFSFGLFIKTARIQENMCWYSGLEYEVESEVSRIVDELYISEKCTDRHIKCLKSKVRNNTHFSVLESRTRNCQSDYKSREDSDLESAASEFLNRGRVKTMLNFYMNECGMEPISSDDGKSVVAGDCK